jgi:ADP-ribosylglycohydrolase
VKARSSRDMVTREQRVLGGLWGAVVGDALGVPVEFEERSEVRSHPVVGMRGHGTHDQPEVRGLTIPHCSFARQTACCVTSLKPRTWESDS